MSIASGCILIALLGLCALSAKSVSVLKSLSPWTTVGWIASFAYGLIAAWEVWRAHEFPPIFPYGVLALMVVAFIVAGVKDERQAEPWYWPTAPGTTRAESRK